MYKMQFLKKNYLFCISAIFTLLIHQLIFQKFFPNNSSYLGHDYSLTLPNLIFGKIWFNNNFLSIPWFSPSFVVEHLFLLTPKLCIILFNNFSLSSFHL